MLKTGVLNNLHKSNPAQTSVTARNNQRRLLSKTWHIRPAVVHKLISLFNFFKKFYAVIISLKVQGEAAAKYQVSLQSAVNSQKCLCSSGVNISPCFVKKDELNLRAASNNLLSVGFVSNQCMDSHPVRGCKDVSFLMPAFTFTHCSVVPLVIDFH